MRRIAVFIDWQNAYKAARTAFGLDGFPNERGNFSPYALACIHAAGNGRGASGAELVRVEIHRGIPSNRHDPMGYGANRKQATAWVRENPEIVHPRLRPLAYRDEWGRLPVEKGIDVQLALAAVENVLLKH